MKTAPKTHTASETIAPGQWRMRNNHTAEITGKKVLVYENPPREFVLWMGRCVECNAPLAWHSTGAYAAVGQHAFDLMELLQMVKFHRISLRGFDLRQADLFIVTTREANNNRGCENG